MILDHFEVKMCTVIFKKLIFKTKHYLFPRVLILTF